MQPLKVEIDGVEFVPRRKVRKPGLFSSALREMREDTEESLERVAEIVGVSKTYLWELESGASNSPSFWIVAELAAHYGVSLDYLAELRH
jgi:transcriptional regulator with XRE-family HTH domain